MEIYLYLLLGSTYFSFAVSAKPANLSASLSRRSRFATKSEGRSFTTMIPSALGSEPNAFSDSDCHEHAHHELKVFRKLPTDACSDRGEDWRTGYEIATAPSGV